MRPLSLSDVPSFFEVMQDEETKRNLESVPTTLEEAKREIEGYLLQEKEKDSEYFSIDIDGRYAGNVVLQHQNWDPASNEGRVHLWIHPEFRKRGLATTALKEVVRYGLKKKFRCIFAQCKAMNKGVIKILLNVGFTRVKTFVNEAGVEKILWIIED